MAYSVIVPSRNIGNLTACVGAIREASEDCRIIVVDDDVNWNDWECFGLIRDDLAAKNIEVHAGMDPFIFARNANIGISSAGTDDVVIMNDDALLRTPAGFGILGYVCQHSNGVGAICPAFDHCGTPNLIWQNRLGVTDEPVALIFACCYIPRSTIDRVGLLDERFGVNAAGPGPRGYGLEDDDYSLRIRKAGLKLAVYDGVLVDHTTLKSTFRHDPNRPHDVVAHEKLFKQIHGHWPEGHGYPK